MLAAIGLGNISKYIKQINKIFEAIFPKSLAIDSLRDWLAAPMPKRPRCNRRASSASGHPSPQVAPTFTQAAGTVGYACPHYVNNSVVTERSEVPRGSIWEACRKHHDRTMVVGSFLFHFPSIHDITACSPTCALLRPWFSFLPFAFASFCFMFFCFRQVYSFGIVLLELLTASPPATKREATCHWVWQTSYSLFSSAMLEWNNF